jgi:hypothetical protein
MPVTSSSVWNAAQAGLIGNAAATAASAQVNQLLTTHPATAIYQGNRVLQPEIIYSTTQNPWNVPLGTLDVDQPFTMSGTVIGRIQLPVLAVGNGADLLVSLCADNGSGQPGTMVTQTRIPGSWISALGAVNAPTGPATQFPVVQYSNSPLAVAQFNIWSEALQVVQAYNYPAITFMGISATPSTAYYQGYIIAVGGVSNDVALSTVYTIPYSSEGVLSPTVPQPAFPNPNDGSSATIVAVDSSTGAPVVVNCGGGTSYEGAPVTNAFTSSLTTSTGQLSAWAAQAALPAAIQNHGMATWGGYVYVVGGRTSSGLVNTVYYAQVQNGQIAAWNTGTPLPLAEQLPFVVACNGLLVVFGGANASFAGNQTAYYAVINEGGSLGPWLTLPPLYAATYNLNANPYANQFGIISATNFNTLTFSEQGGPSTEWGTITSGAGGVLLGYNDSGNGQVLVYALSPSENQFGTVYMNLVPYISVPLPATGLTSGNTYHILIQQKGGDAVDYLSTMIGFRTYTASSGPTAQTSPPGAYTWTTVATSDAVPIQVFDQTPPAAPGILPWHTWSDQGARITTIVCATTPDQRLLGICEATRMGLALNQNQGFEAGLSPWTWSGGTAVQSTAQSYSGLHCAQITPNGTSASCSFASEILPCLPGQAVTAAGWFYFTNTVTSNFSLSVTWYTAVTGGTAISTTANLVSVSPATWTEVVNNLTAVGGAYGFQMVATLSGTPASSQLWYVDNAIGTYTYTGPQQSSVTQLEYGGNWPSYQTWPPLGSTVLA